MKRVLVGMLLVLLILVITHCTPGGRDLRVQLWWFQFSYGEVLYQYERYEEGGILSDELVNMETGERDVGVVESGQRAAVPTEFVTSVRFPKFNVRVFNPDPRAEEVVLQNVETEEIVTSKIEEKSEEDPKSFGSVYTDAKGYFEIHQVAGLQGREAAKIRGYVTEYRGGRGIQGAKVSYPANIFTVPGDILITKAGYSVGKIQNVVVEGLEDYVYAVPLRPELNPGWTKTPPFVNITLKDQQEASSRAVSGDLEITVEVLSSLDVFLFYVYFGGDQRFPRDNPGVYYEKLDLTIDTSLYPNGPTYLRILTYDVNENSTVQVIPITVHNEAIDEALPGEIEWMTMTSFTFGSNVGFWSDPRNELKQIEGKKSHFDFSTIDESFMLQKRSGSIDIYNRLEWLPAEDADGYKVYRQIEEEQPVLVGIIRWNQRLWDADDEEFFYRFDDFSPVLEVGKKTTYKVVPYNSAGENPDGAIERFGYPIPGCQVYLEAPDHQEQDVSLTPTFSWEIELVDWTWDDFEDFLAASEARDGYAVSQLWIFDATSWRVFAGNIFDADEFSLPAENALLPGQVYSWDIFNALIVMEYEDEEDGWSESVSYAGDWDGSENGEFMFTTTTTLE